MGTKTVVAGVLLILLQSMGFSSAAFADWISYPRVTSTSKFDAIAEWITNECKPNEIGDIVPLHGQLGRGAPFAVQVFCNRGEGRLGKVIAASYLFDQGTFDEAEFSNAVLAGQRIVILLQYAGDRNGIYYLKRVGP